MFKLADILKNLENDNTPEATFMAKLAGVDATTTNNVEPPAAVTTPAGNTTTTTEAATTTTPAVTEPAAVNKEAELRKTAEEADDIGRIMAHSFMDELQKIAVGVTGLTPNPDAIPQNPAVQLSNQDIREADVAKVQQIIQMLTQGERAHGVTGYVQVNGQPTSTTEPVAKDEAPIAADMPKAANAEIIETLYGKYFGKGN